MKPYSFFLLSQVFFTIFSVYRACSKRYLEVLAFICSDIEGWYGYLVWFIVKFLTILIVVKTFEIYLISKIPRFIRWPQCDSVMLNNFDGFGGVEEDVLSCLCLLCFFSFDLIKCNSCFAWCNKI